MKRYLAAILFMALAVYLSGCGKKEPIGEERSEPMNMEALSTMNAVALTQPAPVGSKTSEARLQATQPSSVTQTLGPLPPVGHDRPTAREIQTALKNAGFYTAEVDGKIGPLTKRAITEFQKVNGLEADGKVGPKTWSVLSKYLNPQPATPASAPAKKM